MPLIYPYMARTDREVPVHYPLTITHGRLAYVDELPTDRDSHGILWVRQNIAYRQGRPVFGRIHSRRQQHAVAELLCQVCGGDPDQNKDGILWLLSEPCPVNGPHVVTYPPICRPCVRAALRMCPPLRQRHTLLRVRSTQQVGVRGVPFSQDCVPLSDTDLMYKYGDPQLDLVAAGGLTIALDNYTVLAAALPQ